MEHFKIIKKGGKTNTHTDDQTRGNIVFINYGVSTLIQVTSKRVEIDKNGSLSLNGSK